MDNESVSKLDRLRIQKEKLEARIQKMESLEKTRERKKETRRKILVGSYYFRQSNKK